MKKALEYGGSEKPGSQESEAKGRLWLRPRVCSQDRLGMGHFLYQEWDTMGCRKVAWGGGGEAGTKRDNYGLEERHTLSAEMEGKGSREAQCGRSLSH